MNVLKINFISAILSVSMLFGVGDASSSSYKDLAIVVAIDKDTSNSINSQVPQQKVQEALAAVDAKADFYSRDYQHISLELFGSWDKNFAGFSAEDAERLKTMADTFAKSDDRSSKEPYRGTCYDLQLWCATWVDGKQQNRHFSVTNARSDDVKHIDELEEEATALGGIHVVNIVWRLASTDQQFENDWKKLVRGGYSIKDGSFPDAMLQRPDYEGLKEYSKDYGLNFHISLAKITKKDGKTAFSTKSDLASLKSVFNTFKGEANEVPITLSDLLVTARVEGKISAIYDPIKL